MIEPTSPAIAASEVNKDASRCLGRPNPETPPVPKCCPLCRAQAHESRFGAACYVCIPPHPLAAADIALREFHRFGALQGVIGKPGRVPSKCNGRKGTRRAWKRANPPGAFFRWFWGQFDE